MFEAAQTGNGAIGGKGFATVLKTGVTVLHPAGSKACWHQQEKSTGKLSGIRSRP
jgi:hypothetical protein